MGRNKKDSKELLQSSVKNVFKKLNDCFLKLPKGGTLEHTVAIFVIQLISTIDETKNLAFFSAYGRIGT